MTKQLLIKKVLIFTNYLFFALYVSALIGLAIREELPINSTFSGSVIKGIDNLAALMRNFFTLIVSIVSGVLHLNYIKKRPWLGIFNIALPGMLLVTGFFFLFIISLFSGDPIDFSEALHW